MRDLGIGDWSPADRWYLEFNQITHPVHRMFTKGIYHFSHREDVLRTQERVRESEGWEWTSFLKPCSLRLWLLQFGSLRSDSSHGGKRGPLPRRSLFRRVVPGISNLVPFGGNWL